LPRSHHTRRIAARSRSGSDAAPHSLTDALMEVVFLGTGGPLRHDRACVGLLIVAHECPLLLVDTCGGFGLVQRLAHAGHRLEDVHHVVITHRHGDHVGGVMPLLMRGHPIRIYGSDDALAGAKQLMAATHPEWTSPDSAEFVPVSPERAIEIAGLSISFFAVEHRVPTLAVRITWRGRSVAYSADSVPCEALVECARDTDLFVCDALAAESEGVERLARVRRLMHPTAREAATMALRAETRSLALVHLGSPASPAALRAEAITVYQGAVSVPNDGDRFHIGAA
jgi:ribonuclease BN (tRNA processing enzyme)